LEGETKRLSHYISETVQLKGKIAEQRSLRDTAREQLNALANEAAALQTKALAHKAKSVRTLRATRRSADEMGLGPDDDNANFPRYFDQEDIEMADEELANVTGRPASVVDLVTPPGGGGLAGGDIETPETPEKERSVRTPQSQRSSGDPVSPFVFYSYELHF
jgi:uncharacterized coiled-coil protein SlyX